MHRTDKFYMSRIDKMECKLNDKTLSDLFECAIVNEMKAADIFANFRDAYSFDDGLAKFWDEMHNDEIMHADVLRKIHNDLSDTVLGEKPDRKVCEYAERAYQLILRISEEIPANLDEAYELAHELEFCELNEVYLILLNNKVGDDRAKEFIISEIQNHQKKMTDFRDNFGGREWRRSIKPQLKSK